jgi:hypothetical protein
MTFSPESIDGVRRAVTECTERDAGLLEDLRREARGLVPLVRVIRDRQTTSVAMVASDGGNNKVRYDPFMVQLIRVVDSFGKELCLDAVSPTTDTDELSQRQFDVHGEPSSALGRLMRDVGVADLMLSKLAVSIPTGEVTRQRPEEVPDSWVQTYRDIWEWAVLYDRVVYGNFGTDTLLVRDGLLRAKYFRPPYFERMIQKIEEAIAAIQKQDRRQISLVGLAKHSQVLDRYRLAATIENVFPSGAARYVPVPEAMERKAYAWPEWVRDSQFNAGALHLVRFGDRETDPVWAVDLLKSQRDRAQETFGYLLCDARDGFPVPLYPACLQRAHEHAQVVDWDLDLFQDALIDAVRNLVPDQRRDAVDVNRMLGDTTGRRYE